LNEVSLNHILANSQMQEASSRLQRFISQAGSPAR
jgi:hypothetical protein